MLISTMDGQQLANLNGLEVYSHKFVIFMILFIFFSPKYLKITLKQQQNVTNTSLVQIASES